uniref:Elongation of very long chain fatty acids protein n=1 Tax=Acrobeloides nanus TaxID=290746 RepID=A0A914D9F7_9BILA
MAERYYWPRYGLENYSIVLFFEKDFDAYESTIWFQRNWYHSINVSLLYVILIYIGRRWMASQEPFALNGSLLWWNLGLSIFSLIVELGDTAFIVLRKRPLIFLHWYHHVTVLIYTWHACKDHNASGRWFMWMNFGEHALMYFYYAMSVTNIRFPKQVAILITTLQIFQMVASQSILLN